MKKPVNISDRAIGPAKAFSYKGLARRRNKAVGSEPVGVMDLVSEKLRDQTIQFTITNSSANDVVYAVFPGRLSSVAQIARYAGLSGVDAIVAEGVVKAASDGTTVLGACTSKTLDLATSWVKDHPTRFCQIKLKTDNEAQFGKEFGFAFFGLTRPKGTHTILPNDYITPDQYNKTMCEIAVNFQLDDATVMFFEVGAGRSLDVTMQIAAELNLADGMAAIDEKLAE